MTDPRENLDPDDPDSEILKRVEQLAELEPSALIARLYSSVLGIAVESSTNDVPAPEKILGEIAELLPDRVNACFARIDALARNKRERIVLLRAALLRVIDNAIKLHRGLLSALDEFAVTGVPGARAACIFHAQLARFGDSERDLYPLSVLARELSTIAPRDSLAFALMAVEGGGGRLVRLIIQKAARRFSMTVPPTRNGMVELSFLNRVAKKYGIPFAGKARISDAKSASQSTRFEVIPAETRNWVVPKGDSEYYMFRTAARPQAVLPIAVHALEGGTVSFYVAHGASPEFYVFDADGNALSEFANGGKPFIVDDPMQVAGDLGILADRFAARMNVCHFLLDHFTRVHLYAGVSDNVRFLAARDYPYYREIARLAGLESQFVWPHTTRFSIRAERLLVSDNIKSTFQHPAHCASKWATDFLRRSLLREELPRGRRIFISREDAPSRKILNWTEIAPVLQDWGYEIVRLGDISAAEQFAIFASAGHVVGVHGAGLTNVVFSPHGIGVLEILPPHRANADYWQLCSGMGHRYHALIAEDPELPRPDYATWKSAPNLNNRNVIVPPDKLRRALEELHSAATAHQRDAKEPMC